MELCAMNWTVEVIADRRGVWARTTVFVATKEEAERYARNLRLHWPAVRDIRIVSSTKPVTFSIVKNELTPVKPSASTHRSTTPRS